MKFKFKALSIAVLSTLSVMSHADVLVVKQGEMTVESQSIPGFESEETFGHGYLAIKVSDDYLDQAFNYISSTGVYVEKSVDMHSIEDRKVESTRFLTSQSNTSSMAPDPLADSQTAFNRDLNGFRSFVDMQREKKQSTSVFILDSGSLAHSDVNFVGGYNYVDNDGNYDDFTVSDVDNTTCVSGHGIEMSGIIGANQSNAIGITGVTDADLYMGRVGFSQCSTGDNIVNAVTLADALEDLSSEVNSALGSLPDVVNISLGGSTASCPTFLQESINGLTDLGVSVVVSAGNVYQFSSGLTSGTLPANCQNVFVVGAHDENGLHANYSNQGDQIDVSVEGVRFTTTQFNEYVAVTGTSGAAAAVSGVISTLKQSFPSATNDQLYYVLKETASPIDPSSCLNGCGSGSLNLVDAMLYAEQTLDPQLSFTHSLPKGDDCKVSREIESLSGHIDICNTLMLSSMVSFAQDTSPVEYTVKIFKKEAEVTGWNEQDIQLVAEMSQKRDVSYLPFVAENTGDYTYAAAACTVAGECPFKVELDFDSITYPTSCSQ